MIVRRKKEMNDENNEWNKIMKNCDVNKLSIKREKKRNERKRLNTIKKEKVEKEKANKERREDVMQNETT